MYFHKPDKMTTASERVKQRDIHELRAAKLCV